MTHLPSRQVHLDFHTSEHIPDIGRRFSAGQFQEALKLGNVNSITIFAKCHHSWSYYPTQVGRKHPHLSLDLLGAQIEACHAIGVRCPIYYTVGWSANDALAHPEWTVRERDGTISTFRYDLQAPGEAAIPPNAWQNLCPSGEYRKLMLDQTEEICRLYRVDGFFYDICNSRRCWCGHCRAGMQANGLDADSDGDTLTYSDLKWQRFMQDCRRIIHAHHPDATVFFNGQTQLDTPEETKRLQTHFELEDLPTTWGGYDKLPLRARLYSRYGKPMLGMTGKFHTSWGEFGGFKHPDAMRYEAAAMVAFGASCSIGDQLHPSGAMDLETYRSIGVAYRYMEQIEPYGLNARPFASLALLLCGQAPHDQGTANMLMEQQVDFEVVDTDADLSRYDTVVLTGGRWLTEQRARAISEYLAGGGGAVVLGEAALDAGGERLLLDLGVRYSGPAAYDIDYLVAGDELAEGLVRSPFLNYTAAGRYQADGAAVLAKVHEPYFDRRYAHYCSHQNTPNRPEPAGHGGAFEKGRVIFLPHALGAMYYQHGARVHRQLFINALRRVHRRPALRATLPSAGRVSLLHQPQHRRFVVHLLYAPPLGRGRCQVIEDLPVLLEVPVELRLPETVRRACLPLRDQELTIERDGEVIRFHVPQVQAHQVVTVEY